VNETHDKEGCMVGESYVCYGFADGTDLNQGGNMRVIFNQLCVVLVLFTATITLVSVAQDAPTETTNVAGNWTVSTQGQRGSRTRHMTIQQEGNKISGSIEGYSADDQFQGSVDGNDIHFTVNMNTPRGPMAFEYRGSVQGDSMKGTIQGAMSGTWSAKRKSE
jgi:hypothetical protein